MNDFRTFFFDDGSSRKRWQIAQNGRTLITRSGKLSGALKETTKTYRTSAEARQVMQRQVASKIESGFVELQPETLEINRSRSRKKASERDVKVLESKLGCQLPDEYRLFLLTTNGGRPNPSCVKVPGAKGIDNVGVGVLFHLHPSQPGSDELIHEWQSNELPKGHLPIARSSDVYSISLNPKTFGCVYWWNHESEGDDENYRPSDGYLLAGSFNEFLTRIASCCDEFEEKPKGSKAPVESKTPATKPSSAAGLKRLLALVGHEPSPSKIKEIKALVEDLDLSAIPDGKWPFKNIRNAEILECLLNARLNPEIIDTDNHTLLWLCAGSAPCIDLLLARGVDIEKRSGSERETALMRAMFVQDIPSVKRLIEAGANPTVKLQWYISDRMKSNKELTELVERARARWRKK